jgi:hypothetical protein
MCPDRTKGREYRVNPRAAASLTTSYRTSSLSVRWISRSSQPSERLAQASRSAMVRRYLRQHPAVMGMVSIGSGGNERPERVADDCGCQRLRHAPDPVAGVAAEVHHHLGADNGLDFGTVADATCRIGTSIRSPPVIDRVRRWGHMEPGGLIVRPRTARMLSGVSLRSSDERRTEAT